MLGCDKDMKRVKEYRVGNDFIFTTPREGEDGTLQVLPEEVDMVECYGTCHAFTWFNIAYWGEVVLDDED